MKARSLRLPVIAVVVALLAFEGVRVAAQGSAALTGQVTSSAEGAMQGVLVTARRPGSTMATTVVTDAQGRYAFPAGRLGPGHYDLTIRAVGYDLSGPASADVGARTATTDLKLVQTKDLPSQLSNAEWMMSIPGTPQQKAMLLDCMTCHTMQRIVSSHFTADQFVGVIRTMRSFANNSSPLTPQMRHTPQRFNLESAQRLAAYLASINLSQGPWKYQLKTLPRPTGAATRVIYTTYDLPAKTWEPHDVALDSRGMVWFDDFVEQKLGTLDPKTGVVTQYTVPTIKPGYPNGALDLEIARDGKIWIANMFQGGVQCFDPKTKQFATYPLPAQWQGEESQQTFLVPPGPDGTMFIKDNGTEAIFEVNLAAKTWRPLGPYKDATHTYGTYQIFGDSQGNVYGNDFTPVYGKSIIAFNGKTGVATDYPVSTEVSRPRRGKMDGQDRLWFAEYQGNRIGVLDTKSGKVTTWEMPPYTFPYDAAPGKGGEVWAAGITSDQVIRYDPKTGGMIVYALPGATNARDIYVDNSGKHSVFWVGNNHAAQIYKLEPLE